MNLTERILTGSDCWKAGRTITPKGVMVPLHPAWPSPTRRYS